VLLWLVASGWWGVARADEIVEDPRVRRAGRIRAESLLWFDSHGVAHMQAVTLEELFFLQGYATAKERFFQIDLMRKAAGGKLAELLGPEALWIDKLLRNFAMDRAADRLLEGMSAESLALFESYADGVNAWLADVHAHLESLPPEYERMGLDLYDLIPWRPRDSALTAAVYLFALAGPFVQELTYGVPRALLGEDEYHDLIRFAPPCAVAAAPEAGAGKGAEGRGKSAPAPDLSRLPASLRAAVEQSLACTAAREQGDAYDLLLQLEEGLEDVRRLTGLFSTLELGESNSWAVGPQLTAGGRAIIASDPHLDAYSYNYLFLCRMVSPEGRWTGGGFAGVPGIMLGHSDHHALGFTALYGDMMDLYHELVPLPGHVLFEGELVPLEVTPQRFFANVDGRIEDVTWLVPDPNTYVVPHHGPILIWGPARLTALSLRWTGYEPNQEIDAILALMTAESLDEFLEASRMRKITAMNAVYADVEGNIHYGVFGRFPLREDPYGSPPWTIYDGWGGGEWRGDLDPELLPSVLNPERGWVSTANNDPTGHTFDNDPLNEGAYIGAGYAPGFRSERIDGLIEELSTAHPLTPQDLMAIQADVKSLQAERFLPHLFLAAGEEPELVTPRIQEALDRLAAWNLSCDLDRPEPSIFHVWLGCFAERMLRDDFPWTYDIFAGAKMFARGGLYLLEHPEESATGERLFDDPGRPGTQTRHTIMLEALGDALELLAERFGSEEMDAWEWGGIHRIVLEHFFFPEFDITPDTAELPEGFPADGAAFTVDVASTGIDPQDQTFKHVPVLRYVAELTPGDIRSWWVMAGGNGGAGGDHYGDMMEMWLNNEYFEITDEMLESDRARLLRFLPEEETALPPRSR
jgi:penicillin amidase